MTPSAQPPTPAIAPILRAGAVAAPVLAASASIGVLVRPSGATTGLRCGRVLASNVASRQGDGSVTPDIAYLQCGDANGARHRAVTCRSFPPAGESWGAPCHGRGSCTGGRRVTITATVTNASGSDIQSIGFTCPVNGGDPM